jgi:hypothetical protein
VSTDEVEGRLAFQLTSLLVVVVIDRLVVNVLDVLDAAGKQDMQDSGQRVRGG